MSNIPSRPYSTYYSAGPFKQAVGKPVGFYKTAALLETFKTGPVSQSSLVTLMNHINQKNPHKGETDAAFIGRIERS